MNIKTGSQEEIDAEERLENKRIASAERKWKMELKHNFITERRKNFLDWFNANDGSIACFWIISFCVMVVSSICAFKIVWTVLQ